MSYDELVKGRIYFGGAADAEQAVANEAIDVVVDVRVNGRDEAVDYDYIHAPIADESESTASSIKSGATQVVEAYEAGKNIYIHCGSGGGRAGVMAVATLLELGLAASLDEAEAKAKVARPVINIRPNMQNALEELYK
ncbi:dual specificity protein phosphatase family protein [Solibacillus sp. CAU 1738]|uniref:protein-tyrosine phosphatase family protein n=1 Tax=Solibacillus sp. CAU 1738 TaxID=3140363 RepID=UPI003261C260